jgi:MFS family permease
MGSAIMTCCTPILCYQGIYYLYLVRIVVGICSGLAFPAVNSVYTKWSTPMERSRISAFGISGIYLGAVIAMLLSGWRM